MSELSLSVTGTAGPPAKKKRGEGGRREQKRKEKNSNNDLRREINLLIITAEMQVNWY